MSMDYADGRELLDQMLANQALESIADEIRESLPRGDRRVLLSAFYSEVADESGLSRLFPSLEPVA